MNKPPITPEWLVFLTQNQRRLVSVARQKVKKGQAPHSGLLELVATLCDCLNLVQWNWPDGLWGGKDNGK